MNANSVVLRNMVASVLNQQVQDEIDRLAKVKSIDANLLKEFAYFVIQNSRQNAKRERESLKISEIKQAIYDRFNVENTQKLRESGAFRMATDGMSSLDLRLKATWEMLYRKFVDILPDEENQQGYGCINGVNIFNYFKPWQVFSLDPKTATKDELKKAYYNLCKIYHPDNAETGDRHIFEQIELMYKSVIAGI